MVLASRVIGILILLAALGTGSLALVLYFRTAGFVDRSEETTATIIRFEKSQHDGSTMYSPTFRYIDNEGREQETTSSISTGNRSYSVGDEVSVLYDPIQPSNAALNSFWSLWLGVVIAGGMAGFAALLALVFIVIVPIIIRSVFKDIGRIERREPIA